jgi:DNA-directed RNA polymerase I and III subunit RPAC1
MVWTFVSVYIKSLTVLVYAHQIVWEAKENQQKFFTAPDGVIRPVHPDILIAKLRPGQAINVIMHCHKGIGAEHAKFSPVATGSYRLMPTITITEPIIGADAKKFARCFPRGVIALEPVTKDMASETGSGYEDHEGEMHAVVADAMKDTVSRECLRHAEFKDKVKLGRVQDHFIYRVESTGQSESNDVFIEAVKVLKMKCERAKKTLAAM